MDDDRTPPLVTADAVWERVAAVREHLAVLAHTDLGVLGDDAEDVAVVVEEAARTIPVVQQGLVRQISDRGLHTARQYKSPVPYLRDLLRITESEAAARVTAVDRFQPRTAICGEALPPLYPRVAEAQAAGVISSGHAAVISKALRRLPAAIDSPTRAAAEAQLVETATELDPGRLRYAAKRLGAYLDPDGILATEKEQREAQELTITPGLHGMYSLRGRIDAPTANVVGLAIEALARPAPNPDGTRDPRTATRRRADALGKLATAAPRRRARQARDRWDSGTPRCRPVVGTGRRSSPPSPSPNSRTAWALRG